MKTEILRWANFAIGLMLTQMQAIIGIFVAFTAFLVLDIITGVLASKALGKPITSSRLRWSFAKMLCYFGTFAFTLLIGISINEMDVTQYIFKCELYFAIWTEMTSNLENMMRVAPRVKLFGYLHYMLAFTWAEKIPGLTDFLKEDKKKIENE